MRRAAIITVLLAIVGTFFACAAAVQINAGRDRVTLTERNAWGDAAAAEGLIVEVSASVDRRLIWETRCAPGGGGAPETDFTFYTFGKAERANLAYNSGADPVWIMTDFDRYYNYGTDEPAGVLERAWKELYRETAPGSEGRKQIYLKDYVDCYPLVINLAFPHWSDYLSADDPEEHSYIEEYAQKNAKAILALRDAFQIPVLEEEQRELFLVKREDGGLEVQSCSYVGEDWFQFETVSTLTDSACYFAFDAHSTTGKLVDTSRLPDGFGIYVLPYSEQEVQPFSGPARTASVLDAEGLRCAFPLDPEWRILKLHTDPSQTHLLLHTAEEGQYVLRVIDLASMEVLQRLELMDCPEGAFFNCWVKEDFIVATASSGDSVQLAVAAANEPGAYRVALSCAAGNGDLLWLSRYDLAMAFDGERLAVSGILNPSVVNPFNGGSIYVSVYDASGPRWYTELASSLDAAYPQYDRLACRPLNSEPVHLSWAGAS